MKFNPNVLTDPLGGIATQFGVPSCIMDLTKELLGLLPGDIVGGLQSGVAEGMIKARSAIARVNRTIFRQLGIIEFDEQTGKFTFLSETSQWGVDGHGSNLFGDVGNFLGQVAGAGAELWKNYQVIDDQITAIQDCIGDFQEWLDKGENKYNIQSTGELAATPGQLNVYKAQINSAQAFLDKADLFIQASNEVLQSRNADPSLEPVFVDGVSGTDPIFRLDFGPPQSKQGQFLLSVDGLYYDSQTRTYASGMEVPGPDDLQFIPAADRWTLDHSPNLGGRGKAYSIADLGKYVNTIFDITMIDESAVLLSYYDADHMLQLLISQKNKRIDDIHNNLQDLRVSGYSVNSALYLNYEQQIISEGAAFNQKMNKRKKQIEVAVKTPDLYGSTTTFLPGDVPVNDFSYLSAINLDVELAKQKDLSFDHGEVSGVVLPVTPRYVKASDSRQSVIVMPLMASPIAAGSLLDGEELEVQAPEMALVTGITTEGLVAVYNFTDVNIQTPGSNTFNTLNCNALGVGNRAQTVSTKPKLLFQKGLGIPYFNGIVELNKDDANFTEDAETFSSKPFEIVDAGNYVRLPDSEEMRNLMYSTSGATIDFWTYVPGLKQQEPGFWEHPDSQKAYNFQLSSSTGKWANAHYYRVLLGCENTGGDNYGDAASSIALNESSNFVKGMVMGFSRDPKMYYEGSAVPSGDSDFDPRTYFGATVDNVTPVSSLVHGYASGDSGTWQVSSGGPSPFGLPVSFQQARGTFSVASTSAISYTIDYPGDGYEASSHSANVWLYTSGNGYSAPSGVSGTLDISYYATGTDHKLNIGTPSTVFFIAPTRSYNTSSVGFAKSLGCESDEGEILKFVVPTETTVSGAKLEDCISGFVHMSVVFDVPNDEILVYAKAILLKKAKLSSLFGKGKNSAPQVPTFIIPRTSATSSFEYVSGVVNQREGTTLFDAGPYNNTYFTPWIVGGGWTDGRPVDLTTSSGGFLDTGAGIISSYNGYVGSMKIYSKALNNTEVLNNYDQQKKVYENISI